MVGWLVSTMVTASVGLKAGVLASMMVLMMAVSKVVGKDTTTADSTVVPMVVLRADTLDAEMVATLVGV